MLAANDLFGHAVRAEAVSVPQFKKGYGRISFDLNNAFSFMQILPHLRHKHVYRVMMTPTYTE